MTTPALRHRRQSSRSSYVTGCALLAALLLGALHLGACQEHADPVGPRVDPTPTYSLLALGDSYTVGESIPPQSGWPQQLADSLAAHGDTLANLDLIARTGWTTTDLLSALRAQLVTRDPGAAPYSAVTLMIGVNNQFQGGDPDVFAAELDTLVGLAITLAAANPQRVIAFTIPNYGVTPMGAMLGAARITAEIRAFNGRLDGVMASRGVTLIDITTASELVTTEPELLARDNLHYSGEMYGRWVALMLPTVERALRSATSRKGPGPAPGAKSLTAPQHSP